MGGRFRIEEHYFTETEQRVLEYDDMKASLFIYPRGSKR